MSDNQSDDNSRRADSPWNVVTQRRYDPAEPGELTTEVVYAIAEATGVEPVELDGPPLYESVDVPSIESMFFGPGRNWESDRAVGSVTFHYVDYRIAVDSDGRITVAEQV